MQFHVLVKGYQTLIVKKEIAHCFFYSSQDLFNSYVLDIINDCLSTKLTFISPETKYLT